MKPIFRRPIFVFILALSFCSQVYGVRQRLTVKVQTDGARIPYSSKELLLRFSHELDAESLTDKVDFRDADNSLISNCTIKMFPGDSSGKTVWIQFDDDFSLSESSKYYVEVLKGLRYVRSVGKRGKKRYSTIRKKLAFYFVTTSQCPLGATDPDGERTKYIVISDVHIGSLRATTDKYNWFTENVTEFINFLDDVGKSTQVKELIIAGDFMDEWTIPVDYKPFTGSVNNSDEFFESIMNSAPMDDIKAKLNEIANAGNVKIVYVPGNHDMLMSQTAWNAICTKGHWAGTDDADGNKTGTGLYSPEDGISIEHGHIYDFYNAPDMLSHPDGLLPPGFFISRMYAYNMIHGGSKPAKANFWGNEFFAFTWEVALLKIFGTITPTIPSIITGIDNFTESYTYNQARDIFYNADIAGNWQDRQALNGVYKQQDEISGLLTGAGVWIWGDLEVAAVEQYFIPDRARIVVFGHTHRAMIKEYNIFNKEIMSSPSIVPEKDELGPARKIYANTGTWVDKKLTPKGFQNRTYVVISPAQNDTALDTVSLYQYNGDLDGVNTAVTTVLEESNIHPAETDDDARRNIFYKTR